MCNPYAYAAIRIGQAYMQYQDDKAEANYINAKTDATGKRIRNEAIYKDISLQRKKDVEYDKTAAEKFKIAIEAKEKKGKVKVQLFESNLGGNLFTYLTGDIDRQEGRAFEVQDINYENVTRTIEEDRLAWNRQFTNQIFALPRVAKPNFTNYALSAAGDITSVFMASSAPSTPPKGSGVGVEGGYYTDYGYK